MNDPMTMEPDVLLRELEFAWYACERAYNEGTDLDHHNRRRKALTRAAKRRGIQIDQTTLDNAVVRAQAASEELA